MKNKNKGIQEEQAQVQNGKVYSNALVDSTHVPDIIEYIDHGRNDGQRLRDSVSWQFGNRSISPANETSPLLDNQSDDIYETANS